MKISVIIPALNERDYIDKTLKHLNSLAGDFEIIVVDGGSIDDTREKVKKFPAVKLTSSTKGRSLQMNKGAELATGEILLFLHADTFLPLNAYNFIIDSLKDEKVVAGSFFMQLDEDYWLFKFYTRLSKLNFSLFTYGDHGIFVRKKIFRDIGGYKKIPFMEDIEIQSRLRKVGKFKKLKWPVLTSARRFRKNGLFKQFIFDIYLILLFKAGASPVWLKKFYKDHC